VDHFIPAHNLDPTRIQQEIKALVSNTTSRKQSVLARASSLTMPGHLIIIDTLYQLLSQSSVNITTFLPSLLTPHSSLLAIYHSEQPLSHHIPYQPHPITLLKFLATTILTAHSLSHILASKAARDRSVAGPVFGLTESEEGTVQGLGANDPIGVVVECETRRKSGRATAIWFVVPPVAAKSKSRSTSSTSNPSAGDIILLEDHPLYRTATSQRETPASDDYGEVSFDLSLTEKQRLVREKVDLPYFDAQKDGGGSGEGGRILYDMGVEDDFDEEEDEI
jgi:elongator complex protein 5